MKSKKTKALKKFDLFLSFGCLVLSFGILLVSFTYSWIRRNWITSIYEDSIKIETSGALAFMLDGDSTAKNAVSILTQLGMSNFVLKPVSNASGESEDFFTLNKEIAGQETYEHLMQQPPITPSGWTQIGKSYGYLEFHFTLLGEAVVQDDETGTDEIPADYTKYVYLKDDSYFRAYDETSIGMVDPSYALRISISVGNQPAIVFKRPVEELPEEQQLLHTGINNVKDSSGQWCANGKDYWSEDEVTPATTFIHAEQEYDLHVTKQAHVLSDYDGGITGEKGNRFVTPEKCLCSFASNARQDITVRVWIEGTDKCCDDAIAGLRLQLFLDFEAVNCNGQQIIERVEK